MDLPSVWNGIIAALNSNFSIALTGGAIGAFGGAAAAQYVSESVAKQRSLLHELKQTNKAILLASQICNSALTMKSQFTKPLSEKFEQDSADFAYTANRELCEGDHISISFDFSRFPAPRLPIEPLQKLVYDSLSVFGRELSAVNEIEKSYEGLKATLADRERFMERGFGADLSVQEKTFNYFGLRHKDGKTDTTYPDLIRVMLEYNDDLAYFSVSLCEDLIVHGSAVRQSLVQRSRFIRHHKVSQADFSGPKGSGLLPSPENYNGWHRQFARQSTSE